MATARALQWRDSFPPGFVLRCLMKLSPAGPRHPGRRVRRGAEAYTAILRSLAGRAKLWADHEFIEDAHSAGTGLLNASDAVSPWPGRSHRPAAGDRGADAHRRHAQRPRCGSPRYRWGRNHDSLPTPVIATPIVAMGLADAALVLNC